MEQTHQLTAVVPFHNYSANFDHLLLLLDSLKRKIAVVVVCDSISPDDFETLSKLYADFPNLTFLLEYNKSAARSRNAGLRKVISPWVIFLDCDDLVQIDNYLSLIKSSTDRENDLLVGQIQTFDSKTFRILSETHTKSLYDMATYPAFTRVIYRRQFVGEQEFPEIPLCEDQCFLAKLIAKNPVVHFGDDVLYSYRINNPAQGTNTLFNFRSHLQAVDFYDSLLLEISHFSIKRIILILKFRLLVSMIKRGNQASWSELRRTVSNLFKLISNSPWLIGYSVPRNVVSGKSSITPRLILVGGLGNQLFQYIFMKSEFGDQGFEINVNLGNPRASRDVPADIYSFNIREKYYNSTNLQNIKVFVCKSLLMLSSHGRSGLIPTLAFNFIDTVNKFHALVFKGVGLVFLADGVGYFDNPSRVKRFRYYIGCFHSYIWKEKLDFSANSLSLSLTNEPPWLVTLKSNSVNRRIGIVHVRRGDYNEISNLGYLTPSYYESEMKIALDHFKVDAFYIFSDDPNYIRSTFASELLAKCQIIDDDQSNPSANLIAMSLGSYYILSNSTFSWWGASLCESNEKVVVVPKWWYTDGRSPNKIYPPLMDSERSAQLNLISFSLYGRDPKYSAGILRNAEFVGTHMHQWIMRVYCGSEVAESVMENLVLLGCQVIRQDKNWHENGMFWRYMPLGEQGIQFVAFRDADSRLGPRDLQSLDNWVQSGFPAHIIRDHPFHQTPILGGLWGVDVSKIVMAEFWHLAKSFNTNFGEDQRFLSKHVYPEIRNHALIEDRYFCFEIGKKYVSNKSVPYEFMGESYKEDETIENELRTVIEKFNMVRIYRIRLRFSSFLQAKLLLCKTYFVTERAFTIPK